MLGEVLIALDMRGCWWAAPSRPGQAGEVSAARARKIVWLFTIEGSIGPERGIVRCAAGR